ncbi:hypothetical protein Lal_00041803, partial [Lupinus albus]
AQERFKSLLIKCPNHGFDEYNIHKFVLFDAIVGGSLMTKSFEEVIEIIESIATSYQQGHHFKYNQPKRRVLKLDAHYAILAHNRLLTQQIDEIQGKNLTSHNNL